MSIPTDPPRTTKVTTVANLSTTQRFPVERSSSATPPPQTRPPVPPRPAPTVISQPNRGVSKAPSALRDSLEAMKPRPGAGPARVVRVPTYNNPGDPPEGIGSGSVPSGGVKIR
jgi:hypothetical protein